jgi:hypothetical protein
MSPQGALFRISLENRAYHHLSQTESQDAVLDAIARLGGHKIGHNQKDAPLLPVAAIAESTVQ